MDQNPPHGPASALAGWLCAVRGALVLMLLCGLAYPLTTTQVGGWLFPWQAGGSLLERGGRAVGSALVGQAFVGAGYFHGRPSASGYDPFAAAGSNWAASNPALAERVQVTYAALVAQDGARAGSVPADLLSASGSGLDPHISPAAAELQVARVAHSRGLAEDALRELVARHTQGLTWGVLGQPRVNVLELNLALDAGGP